MALGALPDYPWDLMARYRARAEAHEGGVVDVSIGSPVDPTPDVVREALAKATDAHAYPLTAIIRWSQPDPHIPCKTWMAGFCSDPIEYAK